MSKSNLVALAIECTDAMSKYGKLESMPLDALRPIRAFIIEHLRLTAEHTVDVGMQRKLAEVDLLLELRGAHLEPNYVEGASPATQVAAYKLTLAPDWRAHSSRFAKGETPPVTVESLQAAWARDQEVIDDQRAEIAALKQTINQLRQAADKKAETVRRLAANIAEYIALVDKAKELTQRIRDAERKTGARRS